MKSWEESQLQRSIEDKILTSYTFYTIVLVPVCMCKAILSPMAVQLHRAMQGYTTVQSYAKSKNKAVLKYKERKTYVNQKKKVTKRYINMK